MIALQQIKSVTQATAQRALRALLPHLLRLGAGRFGAVLAFGNALDSLQPSRIIKPYEDMQVPSRCAGLLDGIVGLGGTMDVPQRKFKSYA